MKPTPTLLTTAAAVMAVAAPAHAGRAGDGPVDAPNRLASLHSEFTLPGSGWAQNVRVDDGAPRLGGYVLEVPMPTVDRCRIFVSVPATATKRAPTARRHIVRPGMTAGSSDEVVRFDHHGRHGAVRRWAGSRPGADAAGVAFQPMPAKLRTARNRWLLYRFDVGHVAVPTVEDGCAVHARHTGARTVCSVARTLRLADGPAVSEPPVLPIA
jgi:hypothetical protein